jgi:hypothetical protein
MCESTSFNAPLPHTSPRAAQAESPRSACHVCMLGLSHTATGARDIGTRRRALLGLSLLCAGGCTLRRGSCAAPRLCCAVTARTVLRMSCVRALSGSISGRSSLLCGVKYSLIRVRRGQAWLWVICPRWICPVSCLLLMPLGGICCQLARCAVGSFHAGAVRRRDELYYVTVKDSMCGVRSLAACGAVAARVIRVCRG